MESGMPHPPVPRREAWPFPASGGVRAALSFQEHSPEVTLGRSRTAQLQNRKISVQNVVLPHPPRQGGRPGPTASWLPAALPSRQSPLSSPARNPPPHTPTRCGHLTSGATSTPPPRSRLRLARSSGASGRRGGPEVGWERRPPPSSRRPRSGPGRPATAPLFRWPIDGLLD